MPTIHYTVIHKLRISYTACESISFPHHHLFQINLKKKYRYKPRHQLYVYRLVRRRSRVRLRCSHKCLRFSALRIVPCVVIRPSAGMRNEFAEQRVYKWLFHWNAPRSYTQKHICICEENHQLRHHRARNQIRCKTHKTVTWYDSQQSLFAVFPPQLFAN